MASYNVRPQSERKDLDPHELLTEVLENNTLKPYLPDGIEMPDLLTMDIERKLITDGKQIWLSEKWLSKMKQEAPRLLDELKLDKDIYDVWVGHHSWVHEIWAVPVELRIKATNQPIQVNSSLSFYSLEDAISHIHSCANNDSKEIRIVEGEQMRVLVLRDDLLHSPLFAVYSKGKLSDDVVKITGEDNSNHSFSSNVADERFAKLLTILYIWKQREFNKIDKEGGFTFYALALMLIHFLQAGCQPPVLPPLLQINHEPWTSCFSLADIEFKSKNTKSLGNLLFNFFNYYEMIQCGGFDFNHWLISVKQGKPIKLAKPSSTFWIEDPLKKDQVNVMDESKSPAIAFIVTHVFTQIRARLMKDRRLHHLEDFILT